MFRVKRWGTRHSLSIVDILPIRSISNQDWMLASLASFIFRTVDIDTDEARARFQRNAGILFEKVWEGGGVNVMKVTDFVRHGWWNDLYSSASISLLRLPLWTSALTRAIYPQFDGTLTKYLRHSGGRAVPLIGYCIAILPSFHSSLTEGPKWRDIAPPPPRREMGLC